MEVRVFKQMAEEGMKFCFKEDPAGPSCHSGWKLSLCTFQVLGKGGVVYAFIITAWVFLFWSYS